MSKFRERDQIAYIPTHADGDINHPDVEFGFVTSTNKNADAVFCRYWHKEIRLLGTLRTTANSELTPAETLVHHVSIAQSIVDNLYDELGYDWRLQ